MATDTLNIFNCLGEDLAEKKHNFASDQLAVALTNTIPVATNTVKANLTSVVAATNLSGATPFNITTTSSSQTSGTYSLILADLTLTATDTVAPFQYIAIYNETASNDELIGWLDYGSEVNMGAGETFKIDFPDTAILTIA